MRDPRVDAYIKGAPEFAGPLLLHFRELAHKAHPGVQETIKWGKPFFLAGGSPVCFMAAFKQHCAFGFWGSGMAGPLAEAGYQDDGAAGSLGRVTGPKEMPKDKVLLGLLKTAFALAGNEGGKLRRVPAEKPKGRIETPEDLEAVLNRIGALERFDAMSPSCRREYVEWIVEAKRAETRAKRIGEAVGWIAEGKKRNWKYENC